MTTICATIFPFGHDAFTFISGVVTAVAAVLMLGMQVPRNERWRGFRRMRAIMVASYVVLSASEFATSIMQMEEDSPDLLAAVTLIVAACQALLFTATSLTFIDPLIVGKKRLMVHFSAVLAAGMLLLSLMWLAPEVYRMAFWVAVACYVGQLVVYTMTFRRSFGQSVSRIEHHYDEDESSRLRWIKHCFYSALGIGVMALVFSVPNIEIRFYDCFVMAYTAYYVYMCHCMFAYRIGGEFIVEVVGKEPAAVESEQPVEPADDTDAKVQALEAELKKWQDAKLYTRADVSPDEVAAQLGTTRRYLSWYFTTHKHTTFRTWRLKLRIEEAERLLREQPEVSVPELHELVGVADRSNFHRYFRLATGLTPSEYKAKHGAKGEA